MKMKLDLRRITAWALCLLLCLFPLSQKASAASAREYYTLEEVSTCSLDLSYHIDLGAEKQPMEGVEFRLYRVAEITDAGTFHRIAPFDKYAVTATDWLKRASTLAGYVSRDCLEPTVLPASTNARGVVSFTDLEKGLYLIVGSSKTVDGYIYTPTPFLLSLPYTGDGYNWDPDVEIYTKYTRRAIGGGEDPTPATVQYHVLKVWEDEGNEENRPQSVAVDLLRDGEAYGTAVLSAENNWRYDWTGLPADAVWQVVEQEVEGYTVSVAQNGITFVITNTYEEDIEDWKTPTDEKPDDIKPDDGKDGDDDGDGGEDIEDNKTPLDNLPQTGQLWWPVPLLAMGGVALTFLGIMRRRRWNGEDEE